MNFIRYFVYVLILIVLATSIFLLTKNNEKINQLVAVNQELVQQKESKDKIIEEIKMYNLISLKYNGLYLNTNLKDIKGNAVSLKDVVGDNKKIIFNFSSFNCSDCFSKILLLLTEYNDENLIVVLNTNNPRELIFFNSKLSPKIKAYSCDITEKLFPSEVENLPCFFTIDKNLIIDNVFFPLKNDSEFTKKYISNNSTLFAKYK